MYFFSVLIKCRIFQVIAQAQTRYRPGPAIIVFVESLMFHFDEDIKQSKNDTSWRVEVEHIPIDKIMKHYKTPVNLRKPNTPHKIIYGFNVI